MLAVEEPVVRGEDDVRLVELAGRGQPVDDLADGLVDGEQRLETLLVVLANRGDLRGRISGRLRIPAGLSETSASLNEGGIGSGSLAKTLRWRGAGDGVASPLGSSGSRGPPLCGARKATQRKNGRGSSSWRPMMSTAFRASTSVL